MREQVTAPVADQLNAGGDLKIYRRLLGYMKGKRWLFFIAMIGYFFAAYAEVLFAQTLGAVVDVFEAGSQTTQAVASGTGSVMELIGSIPHLALSWGWPLVVVIPSLVCLTALIRTLGNIVGESLTGYVSLHVIHQVRSDLFAKLIYLPVSYFNARANSVGNITNRVTDTVQKLRDTTTEVLRILMQDGFKLIVLIATLLSINWKLTLIFAATFPFVSGIVIVASRRFRRISTNIQSSMGDVTQVTHEAVSAHRFIRSYGGQPQEYRKFVVTSNSNRQQNVKLVTTKALTAQVIQMVVALALGGLMTVLFLPGVTEGMSTGGLVTYIAVAGILVQPVKRLSDVNARLQQGLAAAEEIFENIDADRELPGGTREPATIKGDIEFRNVSYGYAASGKTTLRDVSFSVQPGKTLAIVGESGGGKTTILHLLLGFYRPSEGDILIDGLPIQEYNRAALRKQIAVVEQDVFLFNDSLRNNIAYGELSDRSEKAVQQAAAAANLNEMLKGLPDGMDTLVRSQGSTVSGGQRQRIGIARALLKEAPVLVLDEATSALDPDTEGLVLDAVKTAMRGRTTIMVAHRYSTIASADEVLFVDQGKIAERGSVEELLDQDGLFKQWHQKGTGGNTAPPRSRKSIRQADPIEIESDRDGWLQRAWYGGEKSWLAVLKPVASSFSYLASRKKRRNARIAWQAPVPVVIVGNITAGGTGKTPLVIWLADWLRRRGKTVGIVSRGYRGKGPFPQQVHADSKILAVGDEAPMLAARTGCPVVVAPDRVNAVKHLLECEDVDIVLADDGLQHYALGRQIEIAVVDGARGIGNGLPLPAGPLREPVKRLDRVHWVVSNGPNECELARVHDDMRIEPTRFVNVATQESLAVDEFRQRVGRSVHAYSAIGNPSRFESTLCQLGFKPIAHRLKDHALFESKHIEHPPDAIVVVTEKDWRKLEDIEFGTQEIWYLEVTAQFEDETGLEQRLESLFESEGVPFKQEDPTLSISQS